MVCGAVYPFLWTTIIGVLKKAASCVLGPLSCSRTPVYAPRAQGPAALLDLASLKLRTGERPF